MESIATIPIYAAISCGIALVEIIWRHAERTDEAVKLQRSRMTNQARN
jgi:hypothetical protein